MYLFYGGPILRMSFVVGQYYNVFETSIVYLGSCDFPSVLRSMTSVLMNYFVVIMTPRSRWSFLTTLHYSVWKYSYEGVVLSSHASCNILPVSIQFNIIAVRLRLYVRVRILLACDFSIGLRNYTDSVVFLFFILFWNRIKKNMNFKIKIDLY